MTYNVIKEVQRFIVTCLLTGQYDTEEYGTIAGVIFQEFPFNNNCSNV